MLDRENIEHPDSLRLKQLRALTDPLKVRLLNELHKPKTVTEAASALGVDRNSLYYHVRVLVKLGMVEEVEVRKVKNLTESVYQAVGSYHFIHNGSLESAPIEECYHALVGVMREICDDWIRSLSSGKKPAATAARIILKIKPEKYDETKARLMEMKKKFMEEVISLDDDDDEGIKYSVNITQFEI